jgi:hypothetical protein
VIRPDLFVLAHFDVHRKRNKAQFFWRITLEGLLIPSAILFAVQRLFDLSSISVLGNINSASLFIGTVLLSPFIETLLLQVVPVMIARHFGASYRVQLLAATLVFAASKFPFGIETGILAGLVSGFYLAFTYLHWERESFNSALLVTFGAHATHNLVVCLVGMAIGK